MEIRFIMYREKIEDHAEIPKKSGMIVPAKFPAEPLIFDLRKLHLLHSVIDALRVQYLDLFPKAIMQLGRRSIFSYLSVEFCVVSEYDLRKWFF